VTNETGQRTATISTSDPLKAVREALCIGQTWLQAVHDTGQAERARGVLQRLIEDIDRQRPLGPDGKHGDRHTPTCGCVDGELTFELRMSLDTPGAPVLSPGDIVTITDPLTGDGKPRRYRVAVPLDSAARLVPESTRTDS
jgi:hypothetical protein